MSTILVSNLNNIIRLNSNKSIINYYQKGAMSY